jgi:hypothetical protein
MSDNLKKLPETAEEMIAFIGSNFIAKERLPEEDLDETRYLLSVHDLLSAFSEFFDDEE